MRKFILSVLCLFSLTGYSQIDKFLESVSKSVVYLSGKYIERGILKTVSGTGFFVHKDNSLYLVTANHIAKNLKLSQELTFTDSLGKPYKLSLQEIQDTTDIIWTNNTEADVSVIAIHPESKILRFLSFNSLSIRWLSNKLVAPGRYKEVISFGFPLDLGIEKHFSPISTSAKVASGIIDLKRFDNNNIASFFLLDEPSIPGLSGGPAMSLPSFLNEMDSATVIGLVHGVISDNTGGKFAAIVPSKFVVETINNTPLFTGVYKLYYSNGKLWSEHLYKDGSFIEVLSNYDPKGKMQDRGTLKNGSGTVKYYDEKGKLEVIDYWEDKKFIKRDTIK